MRLQLSVVAVYANQNAWVMGYAQDLDNWGTNKHSNDGPARLRRFRRNFETNATDITEAVKPEIGSTVAPSAYTSALAAELLSMNLSMGSSVPTTMTPAATVTSLTASITPMATSISCEHQDETVRRPYKTYLAVLTTLLARY